MSNVDHNLYGRGGEIRYTGSRCTPGSYYLVRYVSDNMTDDVMKDRREGRKKFEQFGRPIKDVERERGEVTENELDLPRVLPNCACRVYEGFVNVCKDCIDRDECYINHAFDQMVKDRKMMRYEITHDDSVIHTLTTDNPDAEINMTNLMLKLSDESVGVFVLYSVEVDAETGREKSTQIATATNGWEI